MTTYHFVGAVAYDRLGSSWRTAAGLRSVSVTDPATGIIPTNLVQGGVAVSWLTADVNSRYSFTCDVPGVVVDFGAGAQTLYANEVPGLAIASGAVNGAAIDARMKWAPSTAYTLGQQILSPNSDVVKANVAHTSAAAYATDVAKWDLSVSFAPTNRLRDQNGLLASANGVVGNGSTDDTTAMQALLTSAATFGVPVILAPLSVVMVDTLAIPSGCVLNLNGATLKRTNTSGTTICMLTLTGVSNVTIKDGILDGDKASYAATTEWRHGISILGSTNITIRDVVSKLHKGDGVYVGLNVSTECSSIVLDRVTCDANHRQGMSVVAVDGLVATSCRFTNTSGTAPQCGVDVEPNADTALIRGVRFIGCSMTGNINAGIQLLSRPTATVPQGDVSLVDCLINGNLSSGLYFYETQGASVVGGEISGNTQHGVLTGGVANVQNITLSSVAIRENGSAGIRTVAPFTNLRLTSLTVADNSQTTSLGESGINISPTSGASTGLVIIGCVSTGAKQWAGIKTVPSVTGFLNVGNILTGNGSGPSDYQDVATARISLPAAVNGVPEFCGIVGTTAPAAGAAGALPATPAGYYSVKINGTSRQIAYY